MTELKETISGYTDKDLLEQYFRHKDEYTPQALDIMREEISRRNLGEKDFQEFLTRQPGEVEIDEGGSVLQLKSEDFEAFDHTFTHTDILLAHAVLRDNNVAFYIDNPKSSDTIPLETEAEKRYTIHVHKKYIEKAHEILDEHFVKEDGAYTLKYAGARDRLKAFNFYDIHLSELAAKEEVEVEIPSGEKKLIIQYAQKLLNEADEIEERQGRVLFYYDTLEPLIEKLEKQGYMLSRTELLAILELFQVYCEEPDFPESLDNTIKALLSFFLGVERL